MVDVGVAGRGVTRVGLQARLPGEVVLTESSRSEKEPVLLKDEPGLRHAASGPGCHRMVWEDSQSPREAQGVCVQGMLGLSGARAGGCRVEVWGEEGPSMQSGPASKRLAVQRR